MKVQPSSMVIGDRIKIGQIVGGIVTMACLFYDWMNPDKPLPAAFVAVTSQVLIGLVQIVVVNWLGVSIPEGVDSVVD